MWEKISQIEPLFGMSRDEVFITFQNLQLAANLPYGLLNMNVESKIFIDTDTKKLHCIGNIDDSVIKWIRVALRHIKGEKGVLPVGVCHPKTALRKLFIIYTWTLADPGKGQGPLLLLDQTKARWGEKTFLETAPTYLRVSMTALPPSPPPPPLPQGLDPALHECSRQPRWRLLKFTDFLNTWSVFQGAILCFLSGWDEISLVHDILASKISDSYVSESLFGLDF